MKFYATVLLSAFFSVTAFGTLSNTSHQNICNSILTGSVKFEKSIESRQSDYYDLFNALLASVAQHKTNSDQAHLDKSEIKMASDLVEQAKVFLNIYDINYEILEIEVDGGRVEVINILKNEKSLLNVEHHEKVHFKTLSGYYIKGKNSPVLGSLFNKEARSLSLDDSEFLRLIRNLSQYYDTDYDETLPVSFFGMYNYLYRMSLDEFYAYPVGLSVSIGEFKSSTSTLSKQSIAESYEKLNLIRSIVVTLHTVNMISLEAESVLTRLLLELENDTSNLHINIGYHHLNEYVKKVYPLHDSKDSPEVKFLDVDLTLDGALGFSFPYFFEDNQHVI